MSNFNAKSVVAEKDVPDARNEDLHDDEGYRKEDWEIPSDDEWPSCGSFVTTLLGSSEEIEDRLQIILERDQSAQRSHSLDMKRRELEAELTAEPHAIVQDTQLRIDLLRSRKAVQIHFPPDLNSIPVREDGLCRDLGAGKDDLRVGRRFQHVTGHCALDLIAVLGTDWIGLGKRVRLHGDA